MCDWLISAFRRRTFRCLNLTLTLTLNLTLLNHRPAASRAARKLDTLEDEDDFKLDEDDEDDQGLDEDFKETLYKDMGEPSEPQQAPTQRKSTRSTRGDFSAAIHDTLGV